jgi:hypothetical protein
MTAHQRVRALALVVVTLTLLVSHHLDVSAGALTTQPDAAEAAVRDMLQRYAAALESRDAEAVKKVHPSIPTESLSKAFREMRELKVVIDGVRVLSIDGNAARVSCRVAQTLTPKAGAKQTSAVNRVVRLKRHDQSWVIETFER